MQTSESSALVQIHHDLTDFSASGFEPCHSEAIGMASCCSNSETVESQVHLSQVQLGLAFHKQAIRVLESCFNNDGYLDMEKVTTLMWRQRSNSDIVQAIIDLLSKNSDVKQVFDGVEFYLPQLAHMVIHLQRDFPTAALEQFVLTVCQQSPHFALQLHWILLASMQDYAPEDEHGNPNPGFNKTFYMRTVGLLQTIDRCVISGSPRRSLLEQLYLSGAVTEAELKELELADRRFNACMMLDGLEEKFIKQQERGSQPHQMNGGVQPITEGRAVARDIPHSSMSPAHQSLSGTLLFKRWTRLKRHTHPWKTCFFVLEDRMLFCYRADGDTLKRAIPLDKAKINTAKSKHPYYFEVESYYGKFKLRAHEQINFDCWVNAIKDAIESAPRPFFEPRVSSEGMAYADVPQVTKVQEHKWAFFKQQRDLAQQLSDIVEELRFVADVPSRKGIFERKLMDLKLPEHGYLPLCQSTDPFRQILRISPSENRCFKSKARVPGLVTFELQEFPNDVASFLFQLFSLPYHDNTVTFGTTTSRDVSKLETISDNDSEEKVEAPPRSSLVMSSLRRLIGTKTTDDNALEDKQEITVNFPSPHYRKARSIWDDDSTTSTAHNSEHFGISRFRWPSMSLADKISQRRETTSTTNLIAEQNAQKNERRSYPTSSLGEGWWDRVKRVHEASPFKDRSGWQLSQLIAKSNDDVRQEVFVMQLFQFYQNVFQEHNEKHNTDLWLKTYRILSTSNTTGLIEVVTDTVSLDGLKKSQNFAGSLLQHFLVTYGTKLSKEFQEAQKKYIGSLAAYCIVCYLISIKDRHNGNIMLDTEGHILHIDFGFVFGSAPGKKFSMERAPFKLTKEMLAVVGDFKSPEYKRFVDLCTEALRAARNHRDVVITMLEIMMYKSKLPFAEHGKAVVDGFQSRLLLHVPDDKLRAAVENQLIRKSYDHTGANLYDKFQVMTNGIAK